MEIWGREHLGLIIRWPLVVVRGVCISADDFFMLHSTVLKPCFYLKKNDVYF